MEAVFEGGRVKNGLLWFHTFDTHLNILNTNVIVKLEVSDSILFIRSLHLSQVDVLETPGLLQGPRNLVQADGRSWKPQTPTRPEEFGAS